MRGRLVEEVQICIRKIHVVWSLGKYRPWNDVVRPRYVRKEEIVIALSRSTIWHWAWLHTTLHWGEETGMTHWVKRKEEPDMWSFLMLCKQMDFTFSIAMPSISPICITNRRITHRRPRPSFLWNPKIPQYDTSFVLKRIGGWCWDYRTRQNWN